MNRLEKCNELQRLKLVAVDEVHCCSQWGHDFRPDFKFLNILKRQFPSVPLIGLTATATADVVDDVKNILGIPGLLSFYYVPNSGPFFICCGRGKHRDH
ncbi:unnamed protein product [Gongylonema pulchrum]|uniref:DNA 3'-5' helicase n=1 Tax=Gongylonema pulchrum TaxID=637853 RepID=A0A183ER77_9BILA|nr:unnamed protein product [Gongylonema pulchrum]